MKNKYLTKSRLKLVTECPTKLFYTGKKEYANASTGNPFLEAQAEGGFQVGELAKHYFKKDLESHDIHTLDHELALQQTNELLKQESVVIFEPAIRFQDLFIRVDILVKRGNSIKIYEVKAKSFNTNKDKLLSGDGKNILAKWQPYIFDITFQKYVVESAFPDAEVEAFLYLVDKHKVAPTDGLNQKFQIVEDNNRRKGVRVSASLIEKDLSTELLVKVPVDKYCDLIFETQAGADERGVSFKDRIRQYAEAYTNDIKIKPILSKACGECEFKATKEELGDGKLSGFHECWKSNLGWDDADFEGPNVLDIWNFRGKDKFIQKGKIKFSDIYEEDIIQGKESHTKKRQWLQIEKVKNNDDSIWLDADGLKTEMDSWVFPLHFIDFETASVALPFNKEKHPYEGVAFQFSNHLVYEDGRIEHKGEYINTERGVFPNYEFVRRLKAELENDQGSIFMYSNHENTYLNLIHEQLKTDASHIDDKDELCGFIESITESKKDSRIGNRKMIDMLELVKKYYYNPLTNGSNSIKDVLPATLNSSDYLKEKYVKPIYGTEQMPSHNFNNKVWIKIKDGVVVDPYQLLSGDSKAEVKDGGAAMIAYAKMQFEQMNDDERVELTNSLLKYCELDTLAMVLIYEAWRHWLL